MLHQRPEWHSGLCVSTNVSKADHSTGPDSRYTDRYITSAWRIEGEHIRMAGHGELCLDAGWGEFPIVSLLFLFFRA